MSSAAAVIRAALDAAGAKAVVYLNECGRAMNDRAYRGYIGDTIPAAVDVMSLDGYCPSAPNGCSRAAQEAGLMRNIYTHELFPKLLPHQRVFVVPGLFGNGSEPVGAQDEQLVAKWTGYTAWVAQEPRILGINPWRECAPRCSALSRALAYAA